MVIEKKGMRQAIRRYAELPFSMKTARLAYAGQAMATLVETGRIDGDFIASLESAGFNHVGGLIEQCAENCATIHESMAWYRSHRDEIIALYPVL